MKARVGEGESQHQATRTMLATTSSESLDERFAAIEEGEQIEALLLELKEKQTRLHE